ncbi:hypothetical protein CRM22_002929 [Opisthorchis felineus]|uniref:Suppressor of fused-like domain-containing protein n=1 Tax=Opisthorchis felineus TaxID=147828 RepID=A0A4S2M9S1_OPIFE|nr:hypothetical protein CRM22_002929 [Opisthorchis felineus]
MANSAFGPVVGPTTFPVSNIGLHPTRDEQALGLKVIYNVCRNLYPDQPTPLQVTALRKFWMGGPDPLDFINMYSNPGSTELRSPPHWHYVSNGLSDLYGDSRLHNQCASVDEPSGFGFELTLRIRREPTEAHPPTWPAHLLQSLARYVFHSQAQLMVGDHIPWPSALDKQPYSPSPQHEQMDGSVRDNRSTQKPTEADAHSIAVAAAATAASILATNGTKSGESRMAALANPNIYASMVAAALAAVQSTANSQARSQSGCKTEPKPGRVEGESRIHHMLVVEDPQLKRISTPYGYVQFLQLVGLCEEELRLVQRWTGNRVIDIMRRLPETGGGLLVTDMKRKLSLFELEPKLADYVNEQLRIEGSNLSGVTTQYFAWAPVSLSTLGELLPGELEARRHRHPERDHVSSKPYSSSVGGSQAADPTTASGSEQLDATTVPTDLSVSRLINSDQKARLSPGPVAMETEDTVVSSSTKKYMDEDDFVDVVGDSGPSSLVNAKVAATTNEMDACDTPKSLINDVTSHPTSSVQSCSTQSTSAPGTFSAWCARIPSSATTEDSISTTALTASDIIGSLPETPYGPSDLISPLTGPLGFRTFGNPSPACTVNSGPRGGSHDQRGAHTPGSTGEGSAPCTPLAHLSLSPASLELLPTRVIDCLDVHLCREAGEMLPLAVNDRLRHGKHFTFLNSHFPDHAITLVPSGVTGAFVTEENPYVARGPWLQILFPEDFLESLEFQFTCLQRTDDLALPIVFRWPERRLRICLVEPSPALNSCLVNQNSSYNLPTPRSLLPKAVTMNSTDGIRNWGNLNSPSHKPDVNVPSSAVRSPRSFSIPRPDHPLQPRPEDHVAPPQLLPYFPPGCVPPPAMLAAMFSTSSPMHFQGSTNSPSGISSQPQADRSLIGPNQTVFDAKSNWMQFFNSFMNKRETTSGAISPPFIAISEAMSAAMGAMQHAGPRYNPSVARAGNRPTTPRSHETEPPA